MPRHRETTARRPPPGLILPPPPPSAQPRQGGPTALVLSLALHFVFLMTLGILLARRTSGTGAPPDRRIGIAMVHRLPDRDRYVDAAEIPPETSDSVSQDVSSSAAAAPPADFAPAVDLAGVLREMTETPTPVSGSGLAGETSLDGDDFAEGTGSGQPQSLAKKKATLFGVSGFGSRFVYVMDRSDSMNGYGGRPLRAAKTELSRSLSTLSELQQFQIVFYNDQAIPFQAGGITSLIQGDSSLVGAAQKYVGGIRAFGGTEHSAALKMALRMQPDVIFFLTDARIPRLSGSELNEIRGRARSGGTTIHAIEFGSDPAPPTDSFLIDLAKQNGGQYQYVDVRKL